MAEFDLTEVARNVLATNKMKNTLLRSFENRIEGFCHVSTNFFARKLFDPMISRKILFRAPCGHAVGPS